MRRNQRSLLWLGISILAVLTMSTALLVEASPDSETAAPLTTDWSHHHLIFSRPATADRAERVERDPRYWQQLRRHSAAPLLEVKAPSQFFPRSKALPTSKNPPLRRDWAQDMGTGATVGAGNYPAKFSFSTKTASCANDFVVYSTGLSGTSAASIVAYNNVYSGCTGTVPGAYWAYETGGQIVTSPVFSGSGATVAFMQTSGGVSSLVLLKWEATNGSLGSPIIPTTVSNSSYPTCAVPCMTTLALTTTDSNSSVFYDYGSDTAYVGDDLGVLHKFTPVFIGTLGPKEVTTGGWPVNVNAGTTPLTSPVYDSVSTNVFVEDTGGFLYAVSSGGGVTASGQLDVSLSADGGPGLVQGPVVDSAAGLAYVFAPSDGNGGTAAGCGAGGLADCSAVYQLSTSFASGDVGIETPVGSSTVEPAAPNPMYIGAFDSTYANSTDPPTGNLYVCGNTGLNPTLYQVPIAAGVLGAARAIASPTLNTVSPTCGPVTDISNPNATGGAAERLFFNVQNNALATNCGGAGCALSFVDAPWRASTPYSVGQEVLVLRTANHTLWVNVVAVAGTSAATPPIWPATAGALTVNGTATFVNQGTPTLTPLLNWTPTTRFANHTRILDGNGNVEIVTAAPLGGGFSGSSRPSWNAIGLTVPDGQLTWIDAGPLPSAALPATGGTSGFIIDNVVSAGTQAGASQVYFSTLGGQACTGGTGGCAVQASQSALQ
jgi:hypothetical protein